MPFSKSPTARVGERKGGKLMPHPPGRKNRGDGGERVSL